MGMKNGKMKCVGKQISSELGHVQCCLDYTPTTGFSKRNKLPIIRFLEFARIF